MYEHEAQLEGLISKAMDNGWHPIGHNLREYLLGRYDARNIIFNHDFAKALFGDSDTIELGGAKNTYPIVVRTNPPFAGLEVTKTVAWKYHLQQAVIADDPINYMYEVVLTDSASRD